MNQQAIDALQQYRKIEQRNLETAVDNAHRAIAQARLELDRIEAQLVLADSGQPYLRVGTVNGVSAQAVFDAFGAIERIATLDNVINAARKEQA